MPLTEANASPALRIVLQDPQASYLPDGIILGRVVRGVHTVTPQGWVTIKLFGRSKSKMVVHQANNHTSTYRGRFNFFVVSEKLYEGPIHIPPGGESQAWPFALAVPLHPDPRMLVDDNLPDCSNLSLQPADIVKQPLPAAFYYEGSHWSTRFHGFVEYYLEAELHLSGSRSPAATATLPVVVRPPSSPFPVTDFGLNARVYQKTAASLRLLPGMEKAELSFKQKTQTFFGSSKIPVFVYSLQVSAPTVLQLESPHPIPFQLRAVPNRPLTTEVLRDVPQTIVLTELRFVLRTRTAVRCAGSFRNAHDVDRTDKNYIDLGLPLRNLGSSLVVPTSDKEPPLDVGALLELRLGHQCASVLGQPLPRFEAPLAPSFRTYNVSRSYEMEWKATVSVAGETASLTDTHRLSILAPSEEQER